ncbi:MAG: hypothetical protein ACFE9Z_13570 [Promethearchaeota archaeon]
MNVLFSSNGKFYKGPVEKEWMKKCVNGEITLMDNSLILDNNPTYMIGAKNSTAIKYELPIQNMESVSISKHWLLNLIQVVMKDSSIYTISFATDFDMGKYKVKKMIKLLKKLVPS